jgi:hypothetical protein
MKELIQLLHDGKHTLVVANGEIRTFDNRGVMDLYRLFESHPDFLSGASIADKVVGKAAASLMALGQIKELYTDVISQPALDLLTACGITSEYRILVPHVMNRTKSGWCPLETRCFPCETPEACYRQIKEFYSQIAAD